MCLRNIAWFIIDCIWPLEQPPSEVVFQRQQEGAREEAAECEKRIAALSDDEGILSEYLRECAKLLEGEKGRQQSVEVRLTSIMGLSSIAGTIVFGGLLAQAIGALQVPMGWLRWAMALGALYLALQLCRAILASISGLERRNYLGTETHDIFPPLGGESRCTYFRRRIKEYLEVLADHESLNSRKVTQMAVAHRAMRNFLWVLLFIALVGAYGALSQQSRGEDLIQRLRKDHEVQELLRGPQGPPGPRGQPCISQPQPPYNKQRARRP
jgi:hypothetical protein